MILPVVVFLAALHQTHALNVIAAGMGRTGTDSMRQALNALGMGPTHHMEEVMFHPDGKAHEAGWAEAALWRAARKQHTRAWWDQLLAGYNSTADAPSCFFFEELMAVYPEAKVVLTVRDGRSWHKSASSTICMTPCLPNQPWQMRVLCYVGTRLGKVIPGKIGEVTAAGVFADHAEWCDPDQPERAAATLKAWNDRVRDRVPREKLLEFDVKKHGFAELAGFLGVPPPVDDDGKVLAFPHANSREKWFYMLLGMRVAGTFVAALPFIVAAVVWRCCCVKRRGRKEEGGGQHEE